MYKIFHSNWQFAIDKLAVIPTCAEIIEGHFLFLYWNSGLKPAVHQQNVQVIQLLSLGAE